MAYALTMVNKTHCLRSYNFNSSLELFSTWLDTIALLIKNTLNVSFNELVNFSTPPETKLTTAWNTQLNHKKCRLLLPLYTQINALLIVINNVSNINNNNVSPTNIYSQPTVLQTPRFSSYIFLPWHKLNVQTKRKKSTNICLC